MRVETTSHALWRSADCQQLTRHCAAHRRPKRSAHRADTKTTPVHVTHAQHLCATERCLSMTPTCSRGGSQAQIFGFNWSSACGEDSMEEYKKSVLMSTLVGWVDASLCKVETKILCKAWGHLAHSSAKERTGTLAYAMRDLETCVLFPNQQKKLSRSSVRQRYWQQSGVRG